MKKNGKKLFALILGLTMTASMITGCSSGFDSGTKAATKGTTEGSSTVTQGTTVADQKQIKDGGEIVFATSQTCYTLDPASNYDSWYMVRYGVGQTLTKFDDTMTPKPWLLADEGTLADDTLTWTFTIRDDVTFSNGNKLTAEAVKSSIERIFEKSDRATSYFEYTDIKADGQTLTIVTKEPCANMKGMLADPLFVIIDTTDLDESKVEDDGPIGTGPYKFVSFNATTYECVVKKNENYWGKTKPKLDKVTFRMFDEASTQAYALQSGEVDSAYNVGMTFISDFRNDTANYTVSECASGRTDWGFLNQNGVLKDKVLRQAIMKAADKEGYCSGLLYGAYVAGTTPIPASLDYGYGELNDENTYDKEGAIAMLDEAGYKDTDGDGYLETPDGEKINLSLVTYTTRPELQIISEAFQNSCKEIGIQISLNYRDSDTCYNLMGQGDYDIMLLNINSVNTGDPENHFKTYFSKNGTWNTFGYFNQEFEDYMTQLADTSDTDARKDIIKEASQVLMDDACCIYFCYPAMNFVSNTTTVGFESSPADYYWLTENVGIVAE